VSERSEVFLGLIAAASLATALAQIGVVLFAGLAARRIARLTQRIEEEMRPIFGHLDAIGREAARASALATAQVERVDAMFSDVAVRIDQAIGGLQSTMEAPAREGRAILSAFKAALQAIRDIRQNGRARPGRSDDEDALFI
jgi:hypothetical protein